MLKVKQILERSVFALGGTVILAACGQTGALYLPPNAATPAKALRPAPAASIAPANPTAADPQADPAATPQIVTP